MPRALVMNDEVRARVAEQAAWANRPENWYRPGPDQEPPGDNIGYALLLDVGYRAVYTQTVIGGKRYRHLSVSVDGPRYPAPEAAWTIATWYGFLGGRVRDDVTVLPAPTWMMNVNKEEHCIVIAQEIGPESVG